MMSCTWARARRASCSVLKHSRHRHRAIFGPAAHGPHAQHRSTHRKPPRGFHDNPGGVVAGDRPIGRISQPERQFAVVDRGARVILADQQSSGSSGSNKLETLRDNLKYRRLVSD